MSISHHFLKVMEISQFMRTAEMKFYTKEACSIDSKWIKNLTNSIKCHLLLTLTNTHSNSILHK
jgi:hypothetical protein